jgi:hypothetical protein
MQDLRPRRSEFAAAAARLNGQFGLRSGLRGSVELPSAQLGDLRGLSIEVTGRIERRATDVGRRVERRWRRRSLSARLAVR